MTTNYKNKCVIFSAPSGAGKTTIVHYLLKQNLGLEFSVSACSRAARENEKDGKDYYFFSVEDFKRSIKKEDFLEWQEVYKDNYYGTLKSEIERIWSEGKAVIFDVDVVGGLNLKKIFKEKALAIFVQAPSIKILEERLRFRSTETEEKIQMRMQKARTEMEKASDFDAIVVNNDLEAACKQAKTMVESFLNK